MNLRHIISIIIYYIRHSHLPPNNYTIYIMSVQVVEYTYHAVAVEPEKRIHKRKFFRRRKFSSLSNINRVSYKFIEVSVYFLLHSELSYT